MSASTMVESFDMPMIDYNEDGDIPMVGSSSENWFLQPLSRMDEDVHNVGASDHQEIDMMAYEEATTEYEMVDDIEEVVEDANVVDAEVYDVTIPSSPLPPALVDIVENHSVQTDPREVVGLISDHAQVNHAVLLTVTPGGDSDVAQYVEKPPSVEGHNVLTDIDEDHRTRFILTAPVIEQAVEHNEERTDHPEESPLVALQPGDEVSETGRDQSSAVAECPAPAHAEVSEEHHSDEQQDKPPNPLADASSELILEQQRHFAGEQSEDQEGPDEPSIVEDEDAAHVPEDAQRELHVNQQNYIQPPPPIHLTLQVTSTEGDQPDFVLFNLPELGSHNAEEPLVLLQHRPSLFYEPISAVFEAFRQEEYFSHLEELSEAEMVLNAHELQLVISEDNIYAREVSLHDLYAMHQGVGMPGHLRLTLQSIVPRFIARYNVLRDQITRLVLSDESEETRQYVQNKNIVTAEASEGYTEPNETHDAEQELRGLEPTVDGEDAEGEDDEGSGELHEIDDQDGPEPASDGAATADEPTEQYTISTVSENVYEVEQQASHEPEDDGTVEDSDADALHAPAHEESPEPVPEEHATEYADAAEHHEEGDEGYENEFKDNGADDTGTIGQAAIASSEDGGLEAHPNEGQEAPSLGVDDVQAGSISYSTSTSSFGTEDLSGVEVAEELAEEVDESPDLENDTDRSIQQPATVFDEEGKFTDGIDAGKDEFEEDAFGDDDFGDDDLDDSAEGTLEDPTEQTEEVAKIADPSEEPENDIDAASQAVLAESEKFVSDLEKNGDIGTATEDVRNSRTAMTQDVGSRSSDFNATVDTVFEKPITVHKNASKRSLDEADLENEEFFSPPSSPSSPGSKRTRTS